MTKEVDLAVEHLRKGHVILYPTDTIWGIGCDATNETAVEKIYRIKKRMESKSLIVLLSDPEQLTSYVQKVPSISYDLISSISKPTTIIYPNAINLAKNVVADDNTIAIRITRYEFCREMVRKFGKPVVSTSANVSGEPAPLAFSKISEEVLKSVDHVVDFHRSVVHETKPSTIIKIDERGNFNIIRE
jgi:L-threonylcarbamoyladenylate synthase